MKILFDSNVIIDAISKRNLSADKAKELFIEVAAYRIDGYLTTSQITDIYYVLRKYGLDMSKRNEFIKYLLDIFTILPLNKETFFNALDCRGKDFEDNVLMQVALDNEIDCIVTNNKKDFINNEKLVIDSPSEIYYKFFNS